MSQRSSQRKRGHTEVPGRVAQKWSGGVVRTLLVFLPKEMTEPKHSYPVENQLSTISQLMRCVVSPLPPSPNTRSAAVFPSSALPSSSSPSPLFYYPTCNTRLGREINVKGALFTRCQTCLIDLFPGSLDMTPCK